MNTSPTTEMLRSTSTELPGQNVDWLQQVRKTARSTLLEKGFPQKKHEDWKYTNVQPLLEQEFSLTDSSCIGLMNEDIEHLFLSLDENCRMVFVNGRFAPQLSVLKHDRSQFEIIDLAKVITEQPDRLQPYLARYVDPAEHGFNALNTASINDGMYLHIFKNARGLENHQSSIYRRRGSQVSFISINYICYREMLVILFTCLLDG